MVDHADKYIFQRSPYGFQSAQRDEERGSYCHYEYSPKACQPVAAVGQVVHDAAAESVVGYFPLVLCEEIFQKFIIIYFRHNRFLLNTLLISLFHATGGFSLFLPVFP